MADQPTEPLLEQRLGPSDWLDRSVLSSGGRVLGLLELVTDTGGMTFQRPSFPALVPAHGAPPLLHPLAAGGEPMIIPC